MHGFTSFSHNFINYLPHNFPRHIPQSEQVGVLGQNCMAPPHPIPMAGGATPAKTLRVAQFFGATVCGGLWSTGPVDRSCVGLVTSLGGGQKTEHFRERKNSAPFDESEKLERFQIFFQTCKEIVCDN